MEYILNCIYSPTAWAVPAVAETIIILGMFWSYERRKA